MSDKKPSQKTVTIEGHDYLLQKLDNMSYLEMADRYRDMYGKILVKNQYVEVLKNLVVAVDEDYQAAKDLDPNSFENLATCRKVVQAAENFQSGESV